MTRSQAGPGQATSPVCPQACEDTEHTADSDAFPSECQEAFDVFLEEKRSPSGPACATTCSDPTPPSRQCCGLWEALVFTRSPGVRDQAFPEHTWGKLGLTALAPLSTGSWNVANRPLRCRPPTPGFPERRSQGLRQPVLQNARGEPQKQNPFFMIFLMEYLRGYKRTAVLWGIKGLFPFL